MQNISISRYDIFKVVLRFILIAFLCILTSSAGLYVVAVIISKVNFSYNILYPITTASLGLSAALNGFILSRLFQEKGLLWGVFAAIITVVSLTIISVLYGSFALSVTYLTKASVIFLSGAVGGITGINTN